MMFPKWRVFSAKARWERVFWSDIIQSWMSSTTSTAVSSSTSTICCSRCVTPWRGRLIWRASIWREYFAIHVKDCRETRIHDFYHDLFLVGYMTQDLKLEQNVVNAVYHLQDSLRLPGLWVAHFINSHSFSIRWHGIASISLRNMEDQSFHEKIQVKDSSNFKKLDFLKCGYHLLYRLYCYQREAPFEKWKRQRIMMKYLFNSGKNIWGFRGEHFSKNYFFEKVEFFSTDHGFFFECYTCGLRNKKRAKLKAYFLLKQLVWLVQNPIRHYKFALKNILSWTFDCLKWEKRR